MTAKILRDAYEKSLADLQNICTHDEIEDMPYTYAPGHTAGMVTVCKRCEKIMSNPFDKYADPLTWVDDMKDKS